MEIFPAIDLYEGKAVRLVHGDYQQMTVYSEHPEKIAEHFCSCGAKYAHLVDLEGARDGTTPNLQLVERIASESDLRLEIGGGIRSLDVCARLVDAGASRMVLGTALVRDPEFAQAAIEEYGDMLAAGIDAKGGEVAVAGWRDAWHRESEGSGTPREAGSDPGRNQAELERAKRVLAEAGLLSAS